MKLDLLDKVKGLDRWKLTALFLTYTKSYVLSKPLYAGLGHIITFHRVLPKRQGPRVGNTEIEVTPEYLEWTINYFKKRQYHFISLDELYDVLNGRKLDNRFVVFTFDDGYIDNLTYAYPIFKKHNIPFTVYVTTNFPDRRAILWWYLIEDLIAENEDLHLEVEGRPYDFHMVTQNQKETVFDQIRALLIGVDVNDYLAKIEAVFDGFDLDIYGKTEQLALSWQQIQQLSTDPLVTIAAHTVNHLALNKLPEAAIKREIMESKEKIESYIDSEAAHFTYPFGSGREVGPRECQIVKGLGFKTATTTRLANIFPEHRDHLECLPRIMTINEEKPLFLNLWVTGALPCFLYKFKRVITTEEMITA